MQKSHRGALGDQYIHSRTPRTHGGAGVLSATGDLRRLLIQTDRCFLGEQSQVLMTVINKPTATYFSLWCKQMEKET